LEPPVLLEDSPETNVEEEIAEEMEDKESPEELDT
jgi:hypothetical protein